MSVIEAKKLTYKQRKKLPDSVFCYIKVKKDGTKVRKYPIPDLSHAINALARVTQFGTAKMKKLVRGKVYKAYPQLKKSNKVHATDGIIESSKETNVKTIYNMIQSYANIKPITFKASDTHIIVKCDKSRVKIPMINLYSVNEFKASIVTLKELFNT
jgi:hypothetical protein